MTYCVGTYVSRLEEASKKSYQIPPRAPGPIGSLETKEFILDEVARGLGLQRNYFCLLAALLGNYLLTEIDLKDFYASLIPGYEKQQVSYKNLAIFI
ncbi:Constitutive coactivator of PPAR-gamma-like protein 2 [Portunus trituberculatus]|uniref:Constitutive coactivator of PPAR-gamma-like protein 2 n=1 Tax=Portunus trituberculatus TaxID=210409 RepID=A0A5B7KKE7_PORTR|nr:Constitutive coactivator of PPAR-gamma-like protein 2 [Portunus trituberculatus]